MGNETQIYLCAECGQVLFLPGGCDLSILEHPSQCENCSSIMDLADPKTYIEASIKTEDVNRVLFAFGTVGKG